MLGDLEVRTVTDVEAFERLGPEWDALLRRAPNELPFVLHRWMVAWWAHFREDRAAVRDSLFVQTVRTPSGELVAVVPLMRTCRPGRGPAAVRTLTFLGADAYITELRRPIVDPAYESEVADALSRSLASTPGWDWIQWPGLVRTGAFAAGLEKHAHVEWLGELPAYQLELADTWDKFRSGLKRNIKESLRHCYNGPKRDGLELRFDVARTREEIAPALERFMSLHSMRADATDTVEHRNRFASSRARAFLFDLCARLADDDVVRVFTLMVNEKPAACRIGFVLAETLYLYYSGYDPAWRKYSVMTTTVAEAIKYAIDAKLRTVHLSTGTDVSKTRWGATETVFQDAIVVRGSLRSRLARRGWAAAEQARDDERFATVTGWVRRRAVD
jgi:CelD/BcsL family acetyltransferase involved in cellulose biosynthesis